MSCTTSRSPARSVALGSGASRLPSSRRIWRNGSFEAVRRITSLTWAPSSQVPAAMRSSASNTGCASVGSVEDTWRSSQGATIHR